MASEWIDAASFTIGSWPPPRATVSLHFRDYDYIDGVELTASDARELSAMLLDRALSADGDAEWWKNDAAHEWVRVAARKRAFEDMAAVLEPWAEKHLAPDSPALADLNEVLRGVVAEPTEEAGAVCEVCGEPESAARHAPEYGYAGSPIRSARYHPFVMPVVAQEAE